MPDLTSLTVPEARDLLVRREISAGELVRAVLDRIAGAEPLVQAFLTVTADEAVAGAETVGARSTFATVRFVVVVTGGLFPSLTDQTIT